MISAGKNVLSARFADTSPSLELAGGPGPGKINLNLGFLHFHDDANKHR